MGTHSAFCETSLMFSAVWTIMNGPAHWSKYKLGNHWEKTVLPLWSLLSCTGIFQSHFAAYLCKSAHFLCVTAPFPVSVEAIREITQPLPITPFSPLVSFSIFGPLRLFPAFLYLLFLLACGWACIHIWSQRQFFTINVSKTKLH